MNWRHVVFLLLAALSLRADPALDSARQAQQMLGSSVWSQVLRITNESPDERYPAAVHALVFETADILWLYVAGEGTQSLSQHIGRVEKDKRELDRLLRAIAPGFVHHEIVPADAHVPVSSGSLLNGCFIESLVALRDRIALGEFVAAARLFTYYANVRGKMAGHTVLVYETPGQTFVLDPAVERTPRVVPAKVTQEKDAFVRWLRPDLRIVQTRELAVRAVRSDQLYANENRATERHGHRQTGKL